jgi:hypothetical protein
MEMIHANKMSGPGWTARPQIRCAMLAIEAAFPTAAAIAAKTSFSAAQR